MSPVLGVKIALAMVLLAHERSTTALAYVSSPSDSETWQESVTAKVPNDDSVAVACTCHSSATRYVHA